MGILRRTHLKQFSGIKRQICYCLVLLHIPKSSLQYLCGKRTFAFLFHSALWRGARLLSRFDMFSSAFFVSIAGAALVAALQPSLKLKTYVDTLDLHFDFNHVIAAYWTGLPHHRRTPFDISPDGKTGFLAYLDVSGTGVHLQHIDMRTMKDKGPTITIPNVKEAGGLVAQSHGFALLGNEPIPSSVANAPPGSTPVPAIYRYHNGQQQWKTFVVGPGVHASDGLSMAPDINGDLVWSETSGLYGAYFVVTDYTGFAEGHFGDSVQYVDDSGHLKVLDNASSSWGCSHNTGIAFEAADEPPYASICAEDQGAIWLNTDTRGMTNNGVKISNENTTNGASGEPSKLSSQLYRRSDSADYS